MALYRFLFAPVLLAVAVLTGGGARLPADRARHAARPPATAPGAPLADAPALRPAPSPEPAGAAFVAPRRAVRAPRPGAAPR